VCSTAAVSNGQDPKIPEAATRCGGAITALSGHHHLTAAIVVKGEGGDRDLAAIIVVLKKKQQSTNDDDQLFGHEARATSQISSPSTPPSHCSPLSSDDVPHAHLPPPTAADVVATTHSTNGMTAIHS
jgi:hypothetical protein